MSISNCEWANGTKSHYHMEMEDANTQCRYSWASGIGRDASAP